MSLTIHQIISHSTGFSNPRTCNGAQLFQIWFYPRDFLCMFISNGLTSPKWSPAWPTPRLKLSRVQVLRVTVFSICLKMGLCAGTLLHHGAQPEPYVSPIPRLSNIQWFHILLVKFHVQDNSPTFSLIRLINYKSIKRLEMEVRELEESKRTWRPTSREDASTLNMERLDLKTALI